MRITRSELVRIIREELSSGIGVASPQDSLGALSQGDSQGNDTARVNPRTSGGEVEDDDDSLLVDLSWV